MSDRIEKLRERLAGERSRLTDEINAELARHDQQAFITITDTARDRGDDALTDLYSDLELATIQHHVDRLREVEDALERMSGDSYGSCMDCSKPIADARLDADPAVRRCVDCQRGVEAVPSATDVTPSL